MLITLNRSCSIEIETKHPTGMLNIPGVKSAINHNPPLFFNFTKNLFLLENTFARLFALTFLNHRDFNPCPKKTQTTTPTTPPIMVVIAPSNGLSVARAIPLPTKNLLDDHSRILKMRKAFDTYQI